MHEQKNFRAGENKLKLELGNKKNIIIKKDYYNSNMWVIIVFAEFWYFYLFYSRSHFFN